MINKKADIISFLNETIENPICELYYNKDYELVLAVMLSAQTTDKKVNAVTKDLFSKYDTIEKLSNLTINEVENIIKSIGLAKSKSKYFCEIIKKLKDIDKIPNNRTYIESLSGIGRKSTNVILMQLYNAPLVAVDTHVIRVSNRLRLVNTQVPLEIENKLYKYFTKKEIEENTLGHRLVLFGRYFCTAINPKCSICKLNKYCKYYRKKTKK